MWDRTRDGAALRALTVELQEFERALEPHLPAGDAMADAYLAQLGSRCAGMRGTIFVADDEARLLGFVGVLAAVPQEELDEPPGEYAYVTDLVVCADARNRGVGEALLRHAIAYVKQLGARELKIGVLAKNVDAKRLYERLGFADYRVELRLTL